MIIKPSGLDDWKYQGHSLEKKKNKVESIVGPWKPIQLY